MDLYMKIIDKETKRESNLIPIEDAIFNQDSVEFEFGEYGEDYYETLPFNDLLFFIENYDIKYVIMEGEEEIEF